MAEDKVGKAAVSTETIVEDSKEKRLDQFFTAIRAIERTRGSRVWCMVHLDNGAMGHICTPTGASLFFDREDIGTGNTVELLLHSPGGHPEIAYQVMKFFRRRFKKVNVIIPWQAKSAATLMCLAADRIFMGEFSELGPIDIQLEDQVKHGAKSFSPLDEFKSIEVLREQAVEWMHYFAVVMNKRYGTSLQESLKDSIPLVTGLLRPVFEQIKPLDMGEHRRSLAISEDYAKRMIALVGNQNARQIIRKLVWEYPSHDFCIDFEEAKELGLPIERLTQAQDDLLTTSILNLENGDTYHGFAPKQAPAKPAVRKRKSAPSRKATTGRVNGRADDRPAERV